MPLNSRPRVSIIIPVFNSAAYIGETIESVLRQDYQDYEIIVVDDGSTDHTRDVLNKYGKAVTCYSQNHKGPGAARNLGVGYARGEYIAFLDSDDIWLPEKLGIQVALLDANPDLSFVCSEAYVFTNNGDIINLWKRNDGVEESFECLLEDNFIVTFTVLMRKSSFLEVGGFDERLPNAQDYDLWLRLAKNNHRFRYINMPLGKYRRHASSNTRNTDNRVKSYRLLLSKKDIWSSVPFLKKRKRLAGIHYDFAKTYLAKQRYAQAARHYITSVFYHPAVGCHISDEPSKQPRPYRILRVYYLIVKCILKSFDIKGGVAK